MAKARAKCALTCTDSRDLKASSNLRGEAALSPGEHNIEKLLGRRNDGYIFPLRLHFGGCSAKDARVPG
jgi:hypothetical protein